MENAVIGIFNKDKNAAFVIEELKEENYNARDITPLMKSRQDQIKFISDRAGNIVEGVLSGAGAGAVLGAFVVGIPISLFFGLTDALTGIILGVVSGVLFGGIIGVAIGYFVSSDDAKLYHEQLQKDSIFLAVVADENDEEKVKELFEQNGAVLVRIGDAEYLLGGQKILFDEPYRWYPNHEISPFMVVGAKGGESKLKVQEEKYAQTNKNSG